MNYLKPDWIFDPITAPGVVFRQVVRVLICRLRGLYVTQVCFFQFEWPAGYVWIHATGKALDEALLLIGPFVACTVAGSVISLPAIVPMMLFEVSTPLHWSLVWIGASIAAHAFPDRTDVERISRGSQGLAGGEKHIALLLEGLARFGYVARGCWMDLIYGVFVVAVVPYAVLEFAFSAW